MHAQQVSSSPFSVGGDFVSSYLWRGTRFGTGPAIQPYVELSLGNFSAGGWGSYCFTTNEAAEADLYLSYGFDFGLRIGVTDYYFPGSDYFDYSAESGNHAFEVNLGYEIKGLSLSANYFLNEAGGAGTAGGDLYFEAAYGFDSFCFVLGAGNGWHTMEVTAGESDFNICNIGVTASSEIQVTDSFSLPLSGALILNPDTEQFHVVIGNSF
ncbi:MAG: hypothetical protein P1P86_03815 [Bacteroidales bacterium]|nr:hypothetical protein [Bacteroidales bacterium]